ncbi:class I SAM-dependent methyltransferase [Bosea vaviloviae]|uniref:Methyltransferase domain-containing protein n=1 Tax=Bosea vaviloviae TaxID=1526658 RepID=A0A1D7UCK0_9HYPH|nr:class I SAM-dependent methyltransferase [Bosea vaviloviae]AOO85100.1 hypothetical protein BHK69_30870 [Bosea vaviloviae]
MSQTLAQTSNYDPVALHYDSTRNMPHQLLQSLYQRAVAAGMLLPGTKVLDAGCGTAQLSLPLIEEGYQVLGIDVSQKMLDIAREKTKQHPNAVFKLLDVRQTGLPSGEYFTVVVSKLFQHVGSWEKAVQELVRVTQHSGYVLHINEKDAFKNAVRKQFSALCNERGYKRRYVGIDNRAELAGSFESCGAISVPFDASGLAWEKTISYGEALTHLRLRLHSEFWIVPDNIYDDLLSQTEAWVDNHAAGKTTIEQMRPYLTVESFRVS